MPEYYLCSKATGEEITLGTTGEHVIGRGPFLKVTDKRVSRNHAILKITDDGLILYPKHTNPCFYKPVNGESFTTLQQDVSQQLSDQDTISLLPDEHVYTIKVHIPAKLIEDTNEETMGQSPAQNQDKKSDITTTAKSASIAGRSGPKTTSNLDKDTPKDKPLSAPCKKDNETAATTEGITGKTRKLPGWLFGCSTDAPSSAKPAAPAKKKAPAPRRKASTEAEPRVQKPPVKKRKVSVSESEEEEKADTPPAVARKMQADKDGGHKDAGTNENKLPVCPHGKQCYRKNPLHFKEYSHSDREEDEEEDSEKPECEYGTSCYRKNPAHLKEYKHTQPPAAAAAGEKRTRSKNTRPKRDKKKKTVLSGDSDDDGEPNTYNYNDSFIDDELGSSNSSTSYGPDSEDEDWEPVGNSEDVSELVEDAESFITNKKMHRTT